MTYRYTPRYVLAGLLAMLLVVALPLDGRAQQAPGTLAGTVTDGANGEPLPGANVLIVGTQQGAITDGQGRFEITGLTPETYALRVTFIGYEGQTRDGLEVRGGETTTADFVMEASSESLSELVVVGYGSTERRDITGAVSSVDAADLENDTGPTIDQALQGRVAGATVTRNTGRPGAGVSVQIRGLSTLNTGSSEPLYVIDGIPISGGEDGISSPLGTINPEDVKSVEILKDASAAAIYGSRASNGVVLITTKQGTAGDVQVDYSASAGMQRLPGRVGTMDLQQYARFVTARADIVGYNNQPNLTNPDLLGEGSDWQDALFRDAYMTDHTLAVSGGNEQTQFRLSGGYRFQDGIAIASDFSRYSLRLNLNNESTDWLSVGTNLNLSRTSENLNISDDDIISTAIRQRPNIPVRTADGGYGGPDQSEFQLNNPVGLAELNTNEQFNTQAIGKVYANIELLDNLTINNELSGTFGYQKHNTFNPTFEFGARTNDQNESSRSTSSNTFWQLRNYLNYRTGYQGLSVDAMGGHEVQVASWEGVSGSRLSFPGNSIQELGAGDAESANNDSYAGSHSIQSLFSRVNFSYDDRYLVTGNFRADATSNFSPENRWGFFPSVSVGWQVANEPFMQSVDVLDQLKLRVGYGLVGNQDIGGYLYGDTFTIVPTDWGSGVRAQNIGNPGLKWESTASLNVGLDVSVLSGRASLTVDAYNKQVDDLLLYVPLPLYAGTSGNGSINTPVDNIGSLKNRGLEVALSTVNLQRSDFEWRSNAVFTMNRNEVTALNGEGDFLDQSINFFDTATRTVVGEPAGQFYGYVVDGVFQSEDELTSSALPEGNDVNRTQGTWIGDLKFKDLNEDGIINEQDRTFIGDPMPDFQYGLTNTFRYRGADLSVFLNGNVGNDILNQVRRRSEDPASDQGMLESTFDYARVVKIDPDGPDDDPGNFQVENPGTTVPRISDTDPNDNQRISTRFVEDGSYLRVQNVTLGYTLPQDLAGRLRLRQLRVYGTVTNLLTITGYSGYDPEIGMTISAEANNGNGNPLLRGVDTGRYPLPRTFTLGLSVGI